MPHHWHHELYEDAKIAFNSLFYRCLDPPTWWKKHGPVADYFYNTIWAKYPQFLLCDRNWELQAWATKRYPDWMKNVWGSGGLSHKFYLHIVYCFLLFIKGADPSIVQVSEKCQSNKTEQDDKPSKKARLIKKEPAKPANLRPPSMTTSTSITKSSCTGQLESSVRLMYYHLHCQYSHISALTSQLINRLSMYLNQLCQRHWQQLSQGKEKALYPQTHCSQHGSFNFLVLHQENMKMLNIRLIQN